MFWAENKQQCVRINNICNEFKEIISGVPQEALVGPILLKALLHDFFYTIEKLFAHIFADDNTLNVFAKIMHSLKLESETAIKWFSENKMIVNPDKFKATLISKNRSDHILSGFSIGNYTVAIEQSVVFLGIDLDNKLNFNLHIRRIYRYTSNQF